MLGTQKKTVTLFSRIDLLLREFQEDIILAVFAHLSSPIEGTNIK